MWGDATMIPPGLWAHQHGPISGAHTSRDKKGSKQAVHDPHLLKKTDVGRWASAHSQNSISIAAKPGIPRRVGRNQRKLARSSEDFDPKLECLIMPLDISNQIVAKLGFIAFTQNLSVEFL
jgi:hypothetical protein